MLDPTGNARVTDLFKEPVNLLRAEFLRPDRVKQIGLDVAKSLRRLVSHGVQLRVGFLDFLANDVESLADGQRNSQRPQQRRPHGPAHFRGRVFTDQVHDLMQRPVIMVQQLRGGVRFLFRLTKFLGGIHEPAGGSRAAIHDVLDLLPNPLGIGFTDDPDRN